MHAACSRSALIGSDFSDYFTEPEKACAGYQRVFSQGLVTDYPLVLRHACGSMMDVLYNAGMYLDAGSWPISACRRAGATRCGRGLRVAA